MVGVRVDGSLLGLSAHRSPIPETGSHRPAPGGIESLQPFWQTESYDHSVRDLLEGQRIRAYIENNPVEAGLAAHAEEYPWSSANPQWKAETTLGSASLAACATPVDAA